MIKYSLANELAERCDLEHQQLNTASYCNVLKKKFANIPETVIQDNFINRLNNMRRPFQA